MQVRVKGEPQQNKNKKHNSKLTQNEKDGAITYAHELLKKARDDNRSDDILKLEKLIYMLNTKKYGLVWEEHAEKVEEEMKTKIPVFTEDTTKKIVGNPDIDDYNFLLEGDNLHSLHILQKTHAGKIDIIYIDPPYNTRNKSFKYNDTFVDKTDTFAHSKWLSFMNKRLEIARKLLSDNGVIFISIDDREQAQLKLLCDEIFGEENFKSQIVRKTGTPTGQGNNKITREFDYVLVYSKTNLINFNGLPFSEEDSKIYNLEDEWGKYLIRPLRKTGKEDRREDRPTMYYPLIAPDGTEVFPVAPKGYQSRWICSKSSYKKLDLEHRIEWKQDKTGWKVYQKFYLEGRTKQVSNLWTNIEGNKKGTLTLKELVPNGEFDYPKPVEFLKRIIQISSKKDSIILDFFAGSGTTGQAVTELNAEDGGTRKFILATNNENNIAEEVTYERMKRVSTGTEKYESHSLNLKYFKTDFVVKEEFPDVSLEYKLLKYITPLVELEFGINITKPKVQVILSEGQLDKMEESDFIENSTLFINHEIFLDKEYERMFRDKNITKENIPHYYF